jgi:hypothetical protein
MTIRFLTMDITPARREGTITACATALSIHCAVITYQPSITTITLGICSAIFLSQGFVYCETSVESTYEQLEPGEVKSLPLIGYAFPRRITFGARLRTISFLISVVVFLLLLASFRSFLTLPLLWWKREIATVILDCGRWVLICFMVFACPARLTLASQTTERVVLSRNNTRHFSTLSVSL